MSATPENTKRYIPHGKAAEIRGVSGRTLDRWVKSGVIAPPEIINKRKYHDVEAILNVGRSPGKGV